MGLPMLVLLFKLHKWSESAKFFDGSSIGEFESWRPRRKCYPRNTLGLALWGLVSLS
jgi:hypothetical protein